MRRERETDRETHGKKVVGRQGQRLEMRCHRPRDAGATRSQKRPGRILPREPWTGQGPADNEILVSRIAVESVLLF